MKERNRCNDANTTCWQVKIYFEKPEYTEYVIINISTCKKSICSFIKSIHSSESYEIFSVDELEENFNNLHKVDLAVVDAQGANLIPSSELFISGTSIKPQELCILKISKDANIEVQFKFNVLLINENLLMENQEKYKITYLYCSEVDENKECIKLPSEILNEVLELGQSGNFKQLHESPHIRLAQLIDQKTKTEGIFGISFGLMNKQIFSGIFWARIDCSI